MIFTLFFVLQVEHVHVAITLQFGRSGGSYHTQRGTHSIVLISPSGTRSDILKKRSRDTTDKGFENWEFMTVLHWDESPKGLWKLEVSDSMSQDWSHKVLKWRLKFSGTCDIKNVFNIEINETEICGTHCRRGCPAPQQAFSEKCVDCSRYCDCTTGECVSACDESLVADNTLKHCKRSMERGHGAGHSGVGGSSSEDQHHVTPAVSMPLSAKFAIICLSLVVISVMVAGIAYFAAKMPSMKNLPTNGYHSMARYPCADGGSGEKDGGVMTDGEDEGCGVNIEVGMTEDEDDERDVVIGDEEKVKLNVVKS